MPSTAGYFPAYVGTSVFLTPSLENIFLIFSKRMFGSVARWARQGPGNFGAGWGVGIGVAGRIGGRDGVRSKGNDETCIFLSTIQKLRISRKLEE